MIWLLFVVELCLWLFSAIVIYGEGMAGYCHRPLRKPDRLKFYSNFLLNLKGISFCLRLIPCLSGFAMQLFCPAFWIVLLMQSYICFYICICIHSVHVQITSYSVYPYRSGAIPIQRSRHCVLSSHIAVVGFLSLFWIEWTISLHRRYSLSRWLPE